MQNLLATDNYTVALGLAAFGAYVANQFLTPQPLVHPILLGRQSDVERVRKPGESAVYRNYGTGIMGLLPSRPANGIKTIIDLVKSDFNETRSLWNTEITNENLKKRVSSLAAGLVNVVGLQPKESNVLLLLNDGFDFLLSDLALASQSIPSFTISSLSLLSAALDAHPPSAIIVHIHFLSQILEHIAENREFAHHTLILVGEGDLPKVVEKLGVNIVWLADLERKGAKMTVPEATVEPADVYSVSFYPGANNELKATRLSHQNMTAGVAATRALFPMNTAITSADSVLSSHSLSTPFGRVIAYTALYESAHFATSDGTVLFPADESSSKQRSISDQLDARKPSPSILFLTPAELNIIVSSILVNAQRALVFPFAWRHKLFHLRNGFLSKDSFWDKSYFSGARKAVLRGAAESLRVVVVTGGSVGSDALTPARIALSTPILNAHDHPLVAGPVFFSHPLDLQMFEGQIDAAHPQFNDIAHSGPPSTNIEAKLVGIDDAAVENGANPVGQIFVRGPSVSLPLGEEETGNRPGWVGLDEVGMTQANGTWKIIPTQKYKI